MKNNKWPTGVSVVCCLMLIAGCSSSPTYEVDYSYEIIKKAADGSVEVIEKGEAKRTVEGDAGGTEVKGVGMVRTGAKKVGKDTATIEVTYPDKTSGTLELRPKETKEHFHKSGEYGVRVSLTEIRSR